MPDKKFPGFSAVAKSTPLPDDFFSRVLPQIQDIAELKVTLRIFYLVHHRQGNPGFVTFSELLSDSVIMAGMEEDTLRHTLSLAVDRGTILPLNLEIDGKQEDVYFANMEGDRETIDRIRRGELHIKNTIELKAGEERTAYAAKPSNIFALYEQNIGVLTPIIAEELKEAAKLYPSQWIDEAFREAVLLNKRSWKYISRILERWSREGKDSGEYRKSDKKDDPDKYIRGKFGHLVKR